MDSRAFTLPTDDVDALCFKKRYGMVCLPTIGREPFDEEVIYGCLRPGIVAKSPEGSRLAPRGLVADSPMPLRLARQAANAQY